LKLDNMGWSGGYTKWGEFYAKTLSEK